MSKSYEAPKVTVIGAVSTLTLGTSGYGTDNYHFKPTH